MIRKILTVIALVPSLLFAGGFQLNVQGHKSLSMGGTGTALASDASVVYFNPGGVSLLKSKYSFTGGATLLFPKVAVLTPSDNVEYQTSPVGTPIQFYGTAQLNDRVSFGFGVNNQFGSVSSFEDGWEGRFIVQKLALKTFMYQPTISYNINNRIGIGAGFVYTQGSLEYKKAIPVATANYDYGQVVLKGKGTGFSYNLGIQGIIKEMDSTSTFSFLSAGLSYRSQIKLALNDGTAEFTDISVALRDKFPAQTTFDGGLTLPSVLSFGLKSTFTLSSNLNVDVLFDINRTNWSSYDSLKIDFANAETPDAATPKNWQNVSTFRLGTSINYKDFISVRLGTYYDQSPIPDGYVSPELPDKNNISFTAGVGVNVTKKLTVDVAYLLSNFTRKGELIDAGFSAVYKRTVNVVGVSVSYNF